MLRAAANFKTKIKKQVRKTQQYIKIKHSIAKRTIKPLVKISPYSDGSKSISYDSVQSWLQSSQAKEVGKFFADYPHNSLISDEGRKFLYHLIRTMKAKNVVEVGTYYAATSEALTRALWENGEGMLHTTDPYGAWRCPFVIASWPKELRQHIKYYDLNSMDFFNQLEANKVPIDMAFIDGNHDFEYVSFDLASAAKLIQPGGIIVLDNVAQPGPLWAGIDFLRNNPEWKEITRLAAGFNEGNPFDQDGSYLPGIAFMVLQAPKEYVIKSVPFTKGQQPYHCHQLSSLQLSMAKPASGVLHAKIFLRCFSPGNDPKQEIMTIKTKLSNELSYELKLPKPLRLEALPKSNYTVEIVLFWQPDKVGDALYLNELPEPKE